VHARHPRLVYVSISGFGHTGPRREEAGYDAIAQAEGGLMSITGASDGPEVRVGVAVADISAGMFAFPGLLLALRSRDMTGRGQHVDVGLFDSVLALLTYQAGRYFATGESPHRSGNRHLAIAPYDSFAAQDGVLVLAVGNDDQWRRFCAALGLTALGADARFATNDRRVVDYATLRPLIEAATREWPLERLISALREAGVPCGATRPLADPPPDPQ